MRAVKDEEDDAATWYRASFPLENPSTRYRWLLSGGSVGYAWVNGVGLLGHDVPDADDFVLTTDSGGPDWHLRSVVYEIFPDRFASSGVDCRGAGLGGATRLGRPPDGTRADDAAASSTAATSAGSRRGSTTSRASAPICST